MCERVLKTRATPANESTHVSAHCFSAVSLEWCISIFPGKAVLSDGGGHSAAADDITFTFSSKGNSTFVREENNVTIMADIRRFTLEKK